MLADIQPLSDTRISLAQANHRVTQNSKTRRLRQAGIITAALLVLAVLVWQAITAHGNPDPTAAGVSHSAVVLDTGILVFREGLEAILVLAALTASLVRTEEGYWKPVALAQGFHFSPASALGLLWWQSSPASTHPLCTFKPRPGCSPSLCCWLS